jgi:hypothetical protein
MRKSKFTESQIIGWGGPIEPDTKFSSEWTFLLLWVILSLLFVLY